MNKSQFTALIANQTGQTRYRVRKCLKTVLDSIAGALQQGREVDLGPKLGKLKVVTRKRKRVIKENLKGTVKGSIVELHRKHPKSVRLLGRGRDLSENPQPTIVHKNPEPEPVPTRRFAIARPSFRGRPNMPRRRAT